MAAKVEVTQHTLPEALEGCSTNEKRAVLQTVLLDIFEEARTTGSGFELTRMKVLARCIQAYLLTLPQ